MIEHDDRSGGGVVIDDSPRVQFDDSRRVVKFVVKFRENAIAELCARDDVAISRSLDRAD